MSVSVVYWSGTGNTQTMAEAVAKGIEEAGGQANLMEVGSAECRCHCTGERICSGLPFNGSRTAGRK